MARKKHLINVHTSTGTTAPSGASLYLGEIAVQHTSGSPALWIKVGASEESTDYEKFIGRTEILNLLEENKILGPDYTYSGLPYVNSSTTIADAYSALTNEMFNADKVTAIVLNELNDKINELSASTPDLQPLIDRISSAETIIQEDEEIVAGGLNSLNDRVSIVETRMTGDYIPITGYELASGVTEEELTLDEEDTVSEAFGKIQKQMLDNEEAIAAGMNYLNQRITSAETAISQNTGITALSGAVRSLSSATVYMYGGIEELYTDLQNNNYGFAYSYDLNQLSGAVQSISAKTSGVLTINANGVEQGKYSPSANTTIDLQIIQEVTGDDVLLTGYELATGTTEEELAIVATDTVNEAFGKIQKQNYDNEAVVAGALNDLEERVEALEADSGLSADLAALSASVVTNESNITGLSASTDAHIANGGIHVTSEQKTAWTNGANSGASAYTAVTALSAATTGINATLTSHTGNSDIHVTAAQKTAWTNGSNSGASAYTAVIALSAATTALTSASANYFNGAEYVSSAKTIVFKHDSTVKSTIDATDFIKDGMVSSVTITGGNMVITFNTDAGHEDIELALTDIFNPDDYYTKTDINTGISASTAALSAATTAHTANTTVHITADERTRWQNAWMSGVSAYTMVEVLSGAVENFSAATVQLISGISVDLETLSANVTTKEYVIAQVINSLNDKVQEISGNTGTIAGISQTLATHTANTDIHVTSAQKTAWTNGANSGASAYTMINELSAVTVNGVPLGGDFSYSAIPYVNSATSVAAAFSALTREMVKNEYATSQALTDLDSRVNAIPAWATASTKPSYDLDEIPDGTTRKLSDYVYGNAKIFAGTCSTAAATSAKTVDCSAFTQSDLVKGVLIFVTFTATNSAAVSALTLDVNNTGALPLKKIYQISTPANLTNAGELRANQTYMFQYDGTNWVCMTLDYNTDTVPNNLYYFGNVVADNAIPRYTIAMQTSAGTWNSVTVNGVTATTSSACTKGFILGSDILYYNGSGGIASGKTGTNSAGYIASYSIDFRYSSNCTASAGTASPLTTGRPIYFVGTVGSDGLFYLDTTKWWTQELPTTEDGKVYIYVGHAINTYSIALHAEHPIYEYKNGHIRPYQEDVESTLGSSYTYSGLPYVNSSTTVAAAFSAITEEIHKDEYAIALSLTDLDTRINSMSGTSSDISALSAATVGHINNNNIHVTAAQKTAWTNGSNSGASAYTGVSALSITVSGIAADVTTLSATTSTILEAIADDEFVVATAFNDINGRINDIDETIGDIETILASI